MSRIIAEIGSNHVGDYERAKALVIAAARAGADIVKFQLFDDNLWRANDPRHNAVKQYHLPYEWISELYRLCDLYNVEFLCTPFSPYAVQFLNVYVKRWKVASGDLTFRPLLEYISATKKPVLLSCGFAYPKEIDEALKILGPRDITLLHCSGGYPTKPEDADLTKLNILRKFFLPIGLSSHVKQWWADLPAIGLGATVFEKHIDLADLSGPEAGHSLTPYEFEQFVVAVKDCEAALTPQGRFSDENLYARINYRRDPGDWLRPRLT